MGMVAVSFFRGVWVYIRLLVSVALMLLGRAISLLLGRRRKCSCLSGFIAPVIVLGPFLAVMRGRLSGAIVPASKSDAATELTVFG